MRLWRIETLWVGLTALVLILAIWWFPGTSGVKTDSYSVAHPGKKVLFQALRRLEGHVERSTEQLIPNSGWEDRLLFLGPARYPTETEWDQIVEEVDLGATVVFAVSPNHPVLDIPQFGVKVTTDLAEFLDDEMFDSEGEEETSKDSPKTDGEAAADPTEGDESTGPDELELEDLMGPRLNEYTATTDLVEGGVVWKSNAWLEFEDPEEWEVLVSADGKPQVAVLWGDYGNFLISASDDAFTNFAMTDSRRALLAYRILEQVPGYGDTYFDETLNNSGVPKVVGMLFDPKFRPATLQLALLTVLFGWLGSRRFGPLVRDLTVRRRSIVEHAEALGSQYYRAKAGAFAIRNMHEFLKLQLRTLYGTTFRVGDVDAVARQARLKPDEIRTMFKQLKLAMKRHREGKLSNSDSGKVLRKLAKIIARIRSDDLKDVKAGNGK